VSSLASLASSVSSSLSPSSAPKQPASANGPAALQARRRQRRVLVSFITDPM
jgi:hypothetical protein